MKQQIEIWKTVFLGKPQFCGKVSNAQINKMNLQMEKLRSNNCSERHRPLKLSLLLQAERSGTKHPSLGSKKKVKKKVDPLLTGAGELVMCDMEKIKVLNAFSPSVSTEECHWKVALYYLQNVTATLAPDDWKKANMTSIFGKGKKR